MTTPARTPGSERPSASLEAYRRSTLHKLATSPYPDWTLSAMSAVAVPLAIRAGSGFPHVSIMAAFTGMWGCSGYMKYMKDPENGSGTNTAWSLLYLFVNMRKTIAQPKPMPSLVLAGVFANLAISGRKQVEVHFGV
ncbi:hypothetical protein BGZ76_010819 [Entomortierella beljakovae]|nr:hypothetical protein BGZ76_010819 [Entomortierella beljakovae]